MRRLRNLWFNPKKNGFVVSPPFERLMFYATLRNLFGFSFFASPKTDPSWIIKKPYAINCPL